MPKRAKKKAEKSTPKPIQTPPPEAPLFTKHRHDNVIQGLLFLVLACATGLIIQGIRLYDPASSQFTQTKNQKNDIVTNSVLDQVKTYSLDGINFEYMALWGEPEVSQISTGVVISFGNGLEITNRSFYDQTKGRELTFNEYISTIPVEKSYEATEGFVHAYYNDNDKNTVHVLAETTNSTAITIISYGMDFEISQKMIAKIAQTLNATPTPTGLSLTQNEAELKVKLLPDVGNLFTTQNATSHTVEDANAWIVTVYTNSNTTRDYYATFRVDKTTGVVSKIPNPTP